MYLLWDIPPVMLLIQWVKPRYPPGRTAVLLPSFSYVAKRNLGRIQGKELRHCLLRPCLPYISGEKEKKRLRIPKIPAHISRTWDQTLATKTISIPAFSRLSIFLRDSSQVSVADQDLGIQSSYLIPSQKDLQDTILNQVLTRTLTNRTLTLETLSQFTTKLTVSGETVWILIMKKKGVFQITHF